MKVSSESSIELKIIINIITGFFIENVYCPVKLYVCMLKLHLILRLMHILHDLKLIICSVL